MKGIRSAGLSPIDHREDHIAESIASFVRKNNLIYGTRARSSSKPVSWSIALEPLYINSKIWNTLNNATTEIEVFIRRSVKATNPKRHIPIKNYPVCVRPDFVIDELGNVKLIEMNVDRRLDRGISLGVHQYSADAGILPTNRMIDLFSCYREFINNSKKENQKPVVLTVISRKRQNYYLQEKFFAAEMTRRGIKWKVAFINEVQVINGTIFFENKPLDFISFDLEDEDWLQEGWRDIRSCWLASSKCFSQPLGMTMGIDDKLLLAIAGKDLSLFAPTYIVPRELANTQWQNINGLKEAHNHRDLNVVLKRGGTGYNTTGSADVLISNDFNPKDWQRIVEKTIKDCDSDKWVLQKFIKSRRFQIKFRLTPKGKTRTTKAPIRLTAFYMRTIPDLINYSFAGATATIGTDREMLLGRNNVIRALRDCTYAPVAPYLE